MSSLGSPHRPKIPVTMRIRATKKVRHFGYWWRNYWWVAECQLCGKNINGPSGYHTYNTVLTQGRAHMRSKHPEVKTRCPKQYAGI